MCVDMFVGVCVELCIYIRLNICVGMCASTFVDTCLDMFFGPTHLNCGTNPRVGAASTPPAAATPCRGLIIGEPTIGGPAVIAAIDEVGVVQTELGISLDPEAKAAGLELPTATIEEHSGACLDDQIFGHVQDGSARHQSECSALRQLLRQSTYKAPS